MGIEQWWGCTLAVVLYRYKKAVIFLTASDWKVACSFLEARGTCSGSITGKFSIKKNTWTVFQIATGILIFHGNLKCSYVEDKSFSDNFSRLLVNSYCCPKRLTAYMIDISFTCHHRLSNGEGHAFFSPLFFFFFGKKCSFVYAHFSLLFWRICNICLYCMCMSQGQRVAPGK